MEADCNGPEPSRLKLLVEVLLQAEGEVRPIADSWERVRQMMEAVEGCTLRLLAV